MVMHGDLSIDFDLCWRIAEKFVRSGGTEFLDVSITLNNPSGSPVKYYLNFGEIDDIREFREIIELKFNNLRIYYSNNWLSEEPKLIDYLARAVFNYYNFEVEIENIVDGEIKPLIQLFSEQLVNYWNESFRGDPHVTVKTDHIVLYKDSSNKYYSLSMFSDFKSVVANIVSDGKETIEDFIFETGWATLQDFIDLDYCVVKRFLQFDAVMLDKYFFDKEEILYTVSKIKAHCGSEEEFYSTVLLMLACLGHFGINVCKKENSNVYCISRNDKPISNHGNYGGEVMYLQEHYGFKKIV